MTLDSVRLGWAMMVISLFSLCLSSVTEARQPQKNKVATSAPGAKSNQTIQVNTPYCDAYLPYDYNGVNNSITNVLTSGQLPQSFPDDFFKETTTDSIPPNGSLSDPGYPIFADPHGKFMENGSDLSRLVLRLTYWGGDQKPKTIPFCAPPGSDNQNTADIGKEVIVKSPPAPYDPSTEYYLVHVVRWKIVPAKNGEPIGGEYETDSSEWYVFNKSDAQAAHREFPFTFHPVVSGDIRILGRHRVIFLAIHLAPNGQYADFSKNLKISYNLEVSKLVPANVQDLAALLNVIVGPAPKPAGGAEKGLIAPCQPKEFACLYREFLKTFGHRSYDGVYAANELANLQSLPVQITAKMNADLPTTNVGLIAGSFKGIGAHEEKIVWPTAPGTTADAGTSNQEKSSATNQNPSTSDNKSSGKKKTPSPTPPSTSSCSNVVKPGTCSESFAVRDEGLYWWDVSIGVPFIGIKQLQYDMSSSGQITPRTVSKGSAYGFVVLAPWKEDIVDPPSLGIPHILIGLPLSGKVFDSPFVGFGETFNLSKLPSIGKPMSKVIPIGIRFYAGLVENKEFGPPPASGTSPPPSHWVGKLQYGIEFSVRDIADKLKSKSTTTSKNSK
jgi:hypothetical protein